MAKDKRNSQLRGANNEMSDSADSASSESEQNSSESSSFDNSDSDEQQQVCNNNNEKKSEPNSEFRLSCLHDWDEDTQSSCLTKQLQKMQESNSEVLLPMKMKGPLTKDFTPWWEMFSRSNAKCSTTSAGAKSGDSKVDDSYLSWFNNCPAAQSGRNWLCGTYSSWPVSKSSSSQSQETKVPDIAVPSIYDNRPAPKGRRALKRERKAEREKTLGQKWFGMKAPDVDQKLKNDMELIQMRGVLDPKRFYKHRDRKGLPKYFQMGTVVDEGTDFYSSRLTKKQRKQTLVEELMNDANIRQYNKRKYAELQQKMRVKKTKNKKSSQAS